MRVYFHTFGCRANQYDTDVVRQRFSDDGAVVVDDPAVADIAIINSCTVTHESEVKLRRFVRHVAKSGAAQTIVMGCAAALDDGSIAALPSVRAVVANADPDSVLRAAGVTDAIRVGAQRAAPRPLNGKYRALLKIQDGCDEHCTFCATTLARGNNRSRPVAELIEEARALAEHHAEIVLTGVHIGTYGQDRFSDPGRNPGENQDRFSDPGRKPGDHARQDHPQLAFGYPRQDHPQPAFGYPRQDHPQLALGYPRQDHPQPAFGYPRQDHPQLALGYPRQDQPQPVFGSPRQDHPQPASGYPRQDHPQPAFGYPRQDHPQPAFGYPRQDQPQLAFGYPRQDHPQLALGYPRQDHPQLAFGYPRQDQPQPAFGYPRQDQPQPAFGYPRQDDPQPAFGFPRAGARGQNTLGRLLESLINAVPQVRFRLSSVEATEVDDTLAHLLIEAPRNLAAHLHAPLQSGSNRVLKRMGRHWYTAESYRARIEWLAEQLPVFGLGADIIAGFPGETETDHCASLALIEALPFTYLHVFPFSVRPDAPAAKMAGQVPADVIRARARALRELGNAKAAAHRDRRRGAWADGVVSGRGVGKVETLTEDYLTVEVRSEDWTGNSRFAVEIT